MAHQPKPRSTLSPTPSSPTYHHCAIITRWWGRWLHSFTDTVLTFSEFRFIDSVVDSPVVPWRAVDAPESSQDSPQDSVGDASAVH